MKVLERKSYFKHIRHKKKIKQTFKTHFSISAAKQTPICKKIGNLRVEISRIFMNYGPLNALNR